MRSFWEGCGSFFGGGLPFGGHARSQSPFLSAGIPDWEFVCFLGLIVAVTASSDPCIATALFGRVVRVIKGGFSFRRAELNLSGDPSRSGDPKRSGDPRRSGDPNLWGSTNFCGDAELCDEL